MITEEQDEVFAMESAASATTPLRGRANRRSRANAMTSLQGRPRQTRPLLEESSAIRPLAESASIDHTTGELQFGARRSSTTSIGSNYKRNSRSDSFVNELQAKRASLVKLDCKSAAVIHEHPVCFCCCCCF